MARRIVPLAALVAALVLPGSGGGGYAFADQPKPPHKASATCSDYDLEEARITEELAQEPNRQHWVLTGDVLKVFAWNLKWAFDIDVDADKVYVIEAMTASPNTKHVHLFVVKNGCITVYKLTWASIVAEMLRCDAWERGNPHVDGQTDRTVPANRPECPAQLIPTIPHDPVPPYAPDR